MTDITMCDRGDCPSSEVCYRHTATPDVYQSYFAPPYPEITDGRCEYFTPQNTTPIVGQKEDK